jgi:hypothetical protein
MQCNNGRRGIDMETQQVYEVATRPQAQIMNLEDYAMSVDGLVKQVQLIQQVMDKVMREDEHYGTIPGTKKLTFRLDPRYEIIREVRDKDFIAYTIQCSLIHILSGQQIASGLGACNSRETKYRYRYLEESTGQPLPKEYWKAREKGDNKEMKRLVGEGNRAAKIDGVWMIAKSTRVENDNPWDLDNTLIKLSCKRALVAATLNATAASDIFTQDLEDFAEPVPAKEEAPQPTPQAPPITPQPDAKPKSLFEQLMTARGNFASLVKDNKDAVLDLLPDQLGAVKIRWHNASLKGIGGVEKDAPWPLDKDPEPEKPLSDAEPSEDPREAIQDEIMKYKEIISPVTWDAIVKFYRSWETDKADIESLNAMLKQCKQALDKQNEK